MAKAKNTTTANPVIEAPVWDNLMLAEQVEVASTGEVLNPFTKTTIAKSVGGILDILRPTGAGYNRPNGVKVKGTVAAAFGKWNFEGYGGKLPAAEVKDQLKLESFAFPEIEMSKDESPYALVTGTLDSREFAILYCDASPVLLALKRDKTYSWVYSQAFVTLRGEAFKKGSTRAENSQELFMGILKSFKGRFNSTTEKAAPAPKAEKPAVDEPVEDEAAPAPKATKAKAPPAKAVSPAPTPATVVPKKVPSRK